jgi:hypothetical protein
MQNEYFTGVLEDTRTPEEKEKDWSARELIAGAPKLDWVRKEPGDLSHFPIWSQYKTSACVAFGKARQVSFEIFRLTGVWIDLSPASIYQLRSNAPGLGMIIPNANEIVNKSGVTLEALMKSQNLTEDQIMAVHRSKVADLIAKAIAEAVVSYLYIPVGVPESIENIAQIIDRKHAAGLLIFAQPDEYTETPKILYPNLTYSQASIRHFVDGTDFYKNDQYGEVLWIDDSWGVGNGIGGHRNFTPEFIQKRCILADYVDIFEFDPGAGNVPKVSFQRDLSMGMKADSDVKTLQKMLQYEGDFPADQETTGNYGPITAEAVLKWQLRNGIASLQEIQGLGGTKFGPKSRAFANKKYS